MQRDHLLTEYQNASRDVWLWFKNRIGISLDDDWNEAMQSADEIARKYDGTKAAGYAQKYVCMMLNELAEIAKGKV